MLEPTSYMIIFPRKANCQQVVCSRICGIVEGNGSRFLRLFSWKWLTVLVIVIFLLGVYYTINYRKFEVFDWNEQCQPKQNVVFMKTHKTAGSSIQNVFLRYSDTNNLLIALPTINNYFGHPQLFTRYMVPRLKQELRYNIMCHHNRWNYYEIKKLMPDDTVYVTILRDPVQLFESMYSYYNLRKIYNMTVEKYTLGKDSLRSHHNKRFLGRIGRNQMSFDLGLSENFFDEKNIVSAFIENLEKQFLLVMIVEFMDESLVLLKHLLCWTTDDVVTFHHNARLPTKKTALQSEVKLALQKWNSADEMLYSHFQQRLMRQLKRFGEQKMQQEVAELRYRIHEWYGVCVEGKETNDHLSKKFQSHNKQIYGFKLKTQSNKTCENLAKAELPYTNELRIRQLAFYNPPLPTPKKSP